MERSQEHVQSLATDAKRMEDAVVILLTVAILLLFETPYINNMRSYCKLALTRFILPQVTFHMDHKRMLKCQLFSTEDGLNVFPSRIIITCQVT